MLSIDLPVFSYKDIAEEKNKYGLLDKLTEMRNLIEWYLRHLPQSSEPQPPSGGVYAEYGTAPFSAGVQFTFVNSYSVKPVVHVGVTAQDLGEISSLSYKLAATPLLEGGVYHKVDVYAIGITQPNFPTAEFNVLAICKGKVD